MRDASGIFALKALLEFYLETKLITLLKLEPSTYEY